VTRRVLVTGASRGIGRAIGLRVDGDGEGDARRAGGTCGPEPVAVRPGARPEGVAAAMLWLASPEARFSTGTIIDVNGASYLRS